MKQAAPLLDAPPLLLGPRGRTALSPVRLRMPAGGATSPGCVSSWHRGLEGVILRPDAVCSARQSQTMQRQGCSTSARGQAHAPQTFRVGPPKSTAGKKSGDRRSERHRNPKRQ